MFRYIFGSSLVLITAFSLLGCYASKWAKGEKNVAVTTIQPGVTRANAEAILGPPMRIWVSLSSIHYATYEYKAGVAPDWSMAVIYGYLDVMTVGLAEIPPALGLLPYPPAQAQYIWDRIVLSYDDRDVILGIFDEFDELPLDGRSGHRKWGPESTVSEK